MLFADSNFRRLKMGTLLAFAPFFAFVVAERLIGVLAALAAGTGVSALLLPRDALSRTRRTKVLEIGTFLLFGGLTLFASTFGVAQWSIAAVRLCVDAGLLLIVIFSMLIGQPFTLQCAREKCRPIFGAVRHSRGPTM